MIFKLKTLLHIFTLCFALFISACNESISTQINKGYKLQEQGKYKEAIDVYSKVIKKNSKIQEAYYQRGYCFQQIGKFDNALWDYNTVIEMKGGENIRFEYIPNKNLPFVTEDDPDQFTVLFTEVRYQRGITNFSKDSLKSSFEDFKYCINSNYLKGSSYLWIGTIYNKYNIKEKACEYFYKAKNLNEEQADEFIKTYCPK